jgi:hypothetical protein
MIKLLSIRGIFHCQSVEFAAFVTAKTPAIVNKTVNGT